MCRNLQVCNCAEMEIHRVTYLMCDSTFDLVLMHSVGMRVAAHTWVMLAGSVFLYLTDYIPNVILI
jgi:hypothetical protein